MSLSLRPLLISGSQMFCPVFSLPALLATGRKENTERVLFSVLVTKWQTDTRIATFRWDREATAMFPNTDKKKQEYMLP